MEKLPVIFRKRFGEVTAVFPTERWSATEPLTVYAQIGQHGGATLGWYALTKPASDEEASELLRELRGIYGEDLGGEGAVELVVYKRRQRSYAQ